MNNTETMTKEQRNEAGAVQIFGEADPGVQVAGNPPNTEAWEFFGCSHRWRPSPRNFHTYDGMGRVIKAMREKGWAVSIEDDQEGVYVATFTRITSKVFPARPLSRQSSSPSLPTAVLIAALKAVRGSR